MLGDQHQRQKGIMGRLRNPNSVKADGLGLPGQLRYLAQIGGQQSGTKFHRGLSPWNNFAPSIPHSSIQPKNWHISLICLGKCLAKGRQRSQRRTRTALQPDSVCSVTITLQPHFQESEVVVGVTCLMTKYPLISADTSPRNSCAVMFLSSKAAIMARCMARPA